MGNTCLLWLSHCREPLAGGPDRVATGLHCSEDSAPALDVDLVQVLGVDLAPDPDVVLAQVPGVAPGVAAAGLQ